MSLRASRCNTRRATAADLGERPLTAHNLGAGWLALPKASQTPPHAQSCACAVPREQQPPQSSGAASRASRRANAGGRRRMRRGADGRERRSAPTIASDPRRGSHTAACADVSAGRAHGRRCTGAAERSRGRQSCLCALSALRFAGLRRGSLIAPDARPAGHRSALGAAWLYDAARAPGLALSAPCWPSPLRCSAV